MGDPRPEVIKALSDASLDGMAEAMERLNASPGEVLSALFTTLHKTIRMVLRQTKGLDRQRNRGVIIDGLLILFKTAEDAGSIH